MNDYSTLRCHSYDQFISNLTAIEKSLPKNPTDLSQFFDNNKEYIDRAAALQLDSIAAKMYTGWHQPLVDKIRDLVSELLPADQEHIDETLAFLKEKEDIKALVDWGVLMKVLLATLCSGYDDEKSFEIVKIYAEKEPEKLTEEIKNLDIKDEEKRFELAKICAAHVRHFAKKLSNFDIKDDEKRFELAKICAKDIFFEVLEIRFFHIQDENKKWEIKKIHAECLFPGVDFENFNRQDENTKFEFTKKYTRENTHHMLQHLNEFIVAFDIKDEKQRCELAKICVEERPGHTVVCIKEFNIKDAKRRFEIVKLCAAGDGAMTAINIRKFSLPDDDMFLEVAKLCIVQNAIAIRFLGDLFDDDGTKFEFLKLRHTGKRFIQLDPIEFIDKIAALIPPARRHRHHYHGAFAPNSPLRPSITEAAVQMPSKLMPAPFQKTSQKTSKVSFTWARLFILHTIRFCEFGLATTSPNRPSSLTQPSGAGLVVRGASLRFDFVSQSPNSQNLIVCSIARIYEVNPLLCSYGKEIKITRIVTDPAQIWRILTKIDWPTTAPDFDEPQDLAEWDICQLVAGSADGFPGI